MSSKLEKLQKQMAKVQEQIQAEENKLKEEEKKKRNKKIKIIGTYYLDQAEKNGGTTSLAATLDQSGYLKKPADRALFDLPATPVAPKSEKGVSDAE